MAKYKVLQSSDQKLEELARISHNLRMWSKRWKEHYGSENRAKLAVWESKMDRWLEENTQLIQD